MIEPIVLGIVQGVTEWIPVSSKGTVTLVGSLLFGRTMADALLFAIWLHMGTALAAVLVFRQQIGQLLKDFIKRPFPLSPLAAFLLAATVVSGVIGFPILLMFQEASAAFGYLGTGIIGAFLLVTGVLQLRQRISGARAVKDVRPTDGVLAGIAQGFAAIPGLSRSGLTVTMLLARGFDRREALALSFLMSVPATAAAAVYGGWRSGAGLTAEGFVGGVAAFIVGLLTMRGLLAVAGRVNFGTFVLGAGAFLILCAAVQLVWF